MKKTIAALLIAVLGLTGCASIVAKNQFPVMLNSTPSDADISVVDERGTEMFRGKTPTSVLLTSGESYFHPKSYHITFSKPGYPNQYADVKATISGWYFGNIVFGGLIGLLIVDPLTGKMWKLPQGDVSVNLGEQISLNKAQPPVLQIATIDQVPADMREKLVSLN